MTGIQIMNKESFELVSILSTTKELLTRSKNDGFPDDPIEVAEAIDKMISFILNPNENQLPEFATIYFAPTGPLQDIAWSNGWHDAYLELAKAYDKLEYIIKK